MAKPGLALDGGLAGRASAAPTQRSRGGAIQEHILGFPASALDRLGRFQGWSSDTSRYLPELFAHLAVRERAAAEDDPSFKQLIPYVVFVCGREVFHYSRSRHGSEARLHALQSVGVGGHISAGDVSLFANAYEIGMRREVDEEVELPPGEERQHIAGLINDDSTPVGQVHFGVVHVWELERPELRPRERKLIRPGFAPAAELLKTRDAFETWSQFVLDFLARR